MLRNNTKGISLIEAFLSSIIFIVSVAAVFSTLTSLRKPAVNNDLMVGGAIAGRDVLENLRAKMDANDKVFLSGVYTGDRSLDSTPANNPHWVNNIGSGIGGRLYNVEYIVTQVGTSGALQVDTNVYWDDGIN